METYHWQNYLLKQGHHDTEYSPWENTVSVETLLAWKLANYWRIPLSTIVKESWIINYNYLTLALSGSIFNTAALHNWCLAEDCWVRVHYLLNWILLMIPRPGSCADRIRALKNTPFFSAFYTLTLLTSDFRVWKRCISVEVSVLIFCQVGKFAHKVRFLPKPMPISSLEMTHFGKMI